MKRTTGESGDSLRNIVYKNFYETIFETKEENTEEEKLTEQEIEKKVDQIKEREIKNNHSKYQ